MTSALSPRIAPSAEWRAVRKIGDAAAPSIQSAVQRAMVLLRDHRRWGDVEGALVYGNISEALARLPWREWSDELTFAVFDKLRTVHRQARGLVLQRNKSRLSRRLLAKARAAAMSPLDLTNPYSIQWAEQHVGSMIADVTDETRTALREVISRAYANGESPAQIARRVRLLAGLTSKQAATIYRHSQDMQAAGRPASTIEWTVRREVASALRYRADMIAKTETLRAANAGQIAAWQHARSAGEVIIGDGGGLWKVWVVTPDERLCSECEEVDGEEVALDAFFSNGVSEPPLHPSCRCAVTVITH